MNVKMPLHQRGFGLGEFLLVATLLIIVSVIGLRLIPAYMEYKTINKTFAAIANDPDMQKASPFEIKLAFEKRSSIDDIYSVKPADIEISVDNGAPYLSANYHVIIPLVSNISFYLDFDAASDK